MAAADEHLELATHRAPKRPSSVLADMGDARSARPGTPEQLEAAADRRAEQNLQMFKKKHLFVELHELKGDEWHETKRRARGVRTIARRRPRLWAGTITG